MAKNQYVKNITFLLPAGVFIASIFVTVLFWAVLPGGFDTAKSIDYMNFYEPAARDVLTGRGFIRTDGTIATRYPPGWPIMLAGVFGLCDLLNLPEDTVLPTFFLLCFGLVSVLLFLLARGAWGSLPALVSVFIWITCPFVLWLTKQPNVEIPFLVIFYASFYLFWYGLRRKSRAWFIYFLSGLLVGFAMLIRPIVIGIGLVMGFILWIVRRETRVHIRLFLIAMLLLGNLLVVLPWEVWVYSKINRVVVLTTAGHLNIRDGLTFTMHKGFRRGVRLPQDVAALMKDIWAHRCELKSFGKISLFLTKELKRRPLAVTKLFVIKAVRSWYGTDSNRFETPILFIQFFYLILLLCSTIATWKRGGIARQLTVSIWLVVLYFWGVTTIGLSIVRYMIPAMGLLFVLVPGLFFKPCLPKSRTKVELL